MAIDLNIPDLLIRGFFLLVACWIVWMIIRAIRDAIHQYRMGAVYELEQKEKEIQRANRNLSDADLIDQANKGSGIKPNNKPGEG